MRSCRSLFAFCALAFSVTVTLEPSQAFESDDTKQLKKQVRQLCEESGVAGLYFGGIYAFVQNTDYCLLPHYFGKDPAVHERIQDTLREFGKIHKRLAQKLELPLHQLFSEFPTIGVRGSNRGALSSKVAWTGSEDMIAIDVLVTRVSFALWDGKFDHSVYAHELGHYLLRNPSKQWPESLVHLRESSVFREMIPDLVAMELTGQLFEPQARLPMCLNTLRPYREDLSYHNLNSAFFQKGAARKHVVECCQRNDAEEYPALHKACRSFELDGYFRKPITLDEGPIDPAKLPSPLIDQGYLAHEYDAHRLGLPILAFLKSVERQINVAPLKWLVEAITKMERQQNQVTYSCGVEQYEVPSEVVKVWNPRSLFSEMRSRLGKGQKRIFDRLWEQAGMDQAVELSAAESLQRAKERSALNYLEKIEQVQLKNTDFMLSCYDEFKSWTWMKEGNSCSLSCERVSQ